MTTTAGASLLSSAAGADGKNQYFQLEYFYLRNGSQPQRANDFFANYFLPAAKRIGLGPLGFFSPVIGERSPYILLLASHPSLDSFGSMFSRLGADPEFEKGMAKFHLPGDPGYTRRENIVLRAFDAMPALQIPAPDDKRPARIFELRTYESNDLNTLHRKIKMFEGGEMGIFKRLGMSPVFFGEAIAGRNLPSLTYMLSYADLATREKLWNDFGSDPEWVKMRAKPGNTDAEIVSNIGNAILRPTPFSEIR
ncbi:MAG: NIPSNAP family protein [Acidobacteriota bacterium]|nr:NIPSNAP family protein [Acidobacteriota bacterium]